MRGYQKALLLTGSTLLAARCCACLPKYATKKQVIAWVEERVNGETFTCTDGAEKHTYVFTSQVRDLTFQASTSPGVISIDGSDFGYTGDYTIGCDYADQVTAFYADRVYDLMERHGFTEYELTDAPNFSGPRQFLFVMSDDYMSKDLDEVNAFLADLQALTAEEAQYHSGDYKSYYENEYALFSYELMYASPSGYYRTAGPDNYQSDVTVSRPLDVRTHRILDMSYALSNVITPVYDGVLIYVPKKD